MSDRPADRDVRISVRTTYDTKRRIAKAAAHHGLSVSTYMKFCAVLHMQDNDLWALRGYPNRRDPRFGRPAKTKIYEMKDPDER